MQVKIGVRIAWWFSWIYIPLLQLGCSIGLEPDPDKLAIAARRALKTTVKAI